MKKAQKLESLLDSKRKTLNRLNIVKKKIAEEKENEESWPGHESTNYYDDLNQLDVLTAHLESIEEEIRKLI